MTVEVSFAKRFPIDIQNGKIWIQYNGTEEFVGEKLVDLGVPSSDIVIGFYTPFKRQFTSYAVE